MDVLFLFLMIIGLLFVGVPIAVSLGLSSIVFLLLFSDTSLAAVGQSMYQAMAGHYTLLAIPFFILASSFMSTGGVAKRIIRFAIACVGHLQGGLAIAGVLACMMFAALSGSSPATVVAIGSIVIAAMRQAGYTKEFAAGVICNAGTLGILIPPSIVMVVYASATDVSVGRMFLAGVIPGILAGTMLMITIYVIARLRNMPKGQWQGWGEVMSAGRDAFWGLMLIVIIMVGIYGVPGITSGIFTPTEAAAVSAVYAFIVANFIYRDMGPLKDRPLLSAEDEDQGLFGLRVVGLALALAFAGVGIGAMLGDWSIAGTFVTSFAVPTFVVGAVAAAALYVAARSGRAQALRVGGAAVVAAAAVFVPAAFPYSEGSLFSMIFETASVAVAIWVFLGMFVIFGAAYILFGVFSKPATRLATAGGTVGGSLSMGSTAVFGGLPRMLSVFWHKDTRATLFEAGKLTITLMFIIANALILKHVLTDEQVPQHIAGVMLEYGLGPIMFLIVVNVILLIGGQFMEPSGLIVIVAPLVFPIAIQLGIDPIHLGIIMVVNMEIGMITPPVGLNLFVTSGVAGMSVMGVVRAALPFLAVLFVFLILITYVPWISTVLPTAIMGPELVIK